MAEVKDLKSILKSLDKRFGFEVATVGTSKAERTKFSLGTPGLDIMTYNSIPEGIFIEISGPEGSGKTLISTLLASNYSKKEKIKIPEERRHILFVDAEGTADPEWFYTATKYDMNDQEIKTYYVPGQGQSAEELFDIVRDFVQTGEIGLVIFDSLVAIAPQQNINDSFEKKDMGGIAKPVADFVKRCTGLFTKNRTTMVFINGEIDNIGGYGPSTTTPGGTYLKRSCSLRIKVKKDTYFDEDMNELKSTAENPSGNIISTYLLKCKFCRGDRRLGRTYLHYRKGLDILQDTIDVAINLGLIDNSTQGMFKLVDPETGEILFDEEGKELKIRGKKNVKPYFEEHPELWKKLYNRIYEMISVKEDSSVKSFEELLGLDNLQESFNVSDEDVE